MTRMMLVSLAAALLVAMSSLQAAECAHRGALSDRYCDSDHDLIADVDAERLLDPRALIFAYTPVEDPAVYKEVWSEFLAHLSDATGKRVVFFPVQSNAAQVEAMRAGRLHVAGFNTGSTPLAVNCAGFVPFAMMAASDNSFGYEMEIVTHPSSGINTVADLRGKTVAFSSPTSNSGFKAPSAILEAEFGLIGGTDYAFVFSGKHDNTLLGVVNRDYPAGAMANSVKTRMLARGVVNPSDIKVIYTSRTFPTTAFGHVNGLEPDLAKKVRAAFMSFDWTGTRLLAEFAKSGEEQFVPISYKKHWEVVRQIDVASEVTYGCR
jgi:phosphonate transport system substrate-binding protein